MWLHLFTVLGMASALQYAGTQCTGVVDFELEPSTNVAAADANVAFRLQLMPAWLTRACQDAARTAQCGSVYAPKALVGTDMCKSQCQEIMAACESAAELDEQLYMFLSVEMACASFSDINCVPLGELDESLSASPVCPGGMALKDLPPGESYEGHTMGVPGTACALSCPGGDTLFGEAKNKAMELFYWVLSGVAVLCGLAVLIGASPKKYLYSWMFTLGGTVAAAVSFVYMSIGYRDHLCDEDVGHQRRTPLMIVIAVAIHYSYLFSVMWVCLHTISLWAIVTAGTRKVNIKGWTNRFIIATTVTPAIMCAIPAAGNNYGWSVKVFIPFPMMVFEDTQWFFWATFYSPLIVIVTIQVVLATHAILTTRSWQVLNVSRGGATTTTATTGPQRSSAKEVLFNERRKSTYLLILVGVLSFMNAVGVGYALHEAKGETAAGFRRYMKCLFEVSAPGAQGSCDRNDYYDDLFPIAVMECLYICSYPISALVTFGPSNYVRTKLAVLLDKIRHCFGSNRANEPSSSSPNAVEAAVEMRSFKPTGTTSGSAGSNLGHSPNTSTTSTHGNV